MIKRTKPVGRTTEKKRPRRKLTAKERQESARLRELVEKDREEILEQGRQFKAEVDAELELQQVLAVLKSARKQRGLSLSAIKARTGIGRSALSRLENDPHANPTLATVSRYATALGKKVVIRLAD